MSYCQGSGSVFRKIAKILTCRNICWEPHWLEIRRTRKARYALLACRCQDGNIELTPYSNRKYFVLRWTEVRFQTIFVIISFTTTTITVLADKLVSFVEAKCMILLSIPQTSILLSGPSYIGPPFVWCRSLIDCAKEETVF